MTTETTVKTASAQPENVRQALANIVAAFGQDWDSEGYDDKLQAAINDGKAILATPTRVKSETSAAASLTSRQTIKLANDAFNALSVLDSIDWRNHREQLYQMTSREEREHRGFLPEFAASHTSDTASVAECARLFAVKRVAEYLNGESFPLGKDFLHIQKSCFYAAGLVDEFRDKIAAAWSKFDVAILADLNYTTIVKVKRA